MAENNDTFTIKLQVYDRDFNVTIARKDEELYRRAAKLITNKINEYYNNIKRKDPLDILYMVLIDIALRNELLASKNDTEPYVKIISELTQEIEEELNEK